MPGIKELKCMFLLCCFLAALTAHAQDNGAAARQHMAKQEYQQAIELYANLYDKDPVSFYNEYFEALLTAKDFKKAEKLVNSRIDYQSRNPLLYIDKGHLLELQGKTKKAEEQYMNVLQLVNGDDMITSEMVNKFVAIGNDNYAVGVYERAKILRALADELVTRRSRIAAIECLNTGKPSREAEGDVDSGIAPGTLWADIPEDWTCPECGVDKDDFSLLD